MGGSLTPGYPVAPLVSNDIRKEAPSARLLLKPSLLGGECMTVVLEETFCDYQHGRYACIPTDAFYK